MPWLLQNNQLSAFGSVSLMPTGSNIELDTSNARNLTRNLSQYHIIDWPGFRANIFQNTISRQTRRKIAAMVLYPIEYTARPYFAWPVDIIVNNSRTVVGYICNVANNVEALSDFLKNHRVPYCMRIRIAQNLCVALNVFHRQGLVFGNLNPDCIYVDPKTLRVFIDPKIDPQFDTRSGELWSLFTSKYGVSQYLAPEIHEWLLARRPLQEIATQRLYQFRWIVQSKGIRSCFSKNTDLYSLGVIVFALINNNMHPMSCIVRNTRQLGNINQLDNTRSTSPRTSSTLVGIPPRTSFFDRTFGVFAYREFWRRKNGGSNLYDRCFGTPNNQRSSRAYHQILHELCFGGGVSGTVFVRTSVRKRPSALEWFNFLERKSKTLSARFSRLYDIQDLVDKVQPEPNEVSSSLERHEIISQYPSDQVGSESITSPRVFWRTTVLLSLVIGASCALSTLFTIDISDFNKLGSNGEGIEFLLPVVNTHINIVFVETFVSLLVCFILNIFLSKLRGLEGYRPWHYAISIGVVALLAICAVLLGGVS